MILKVGVYHRLKALILRIFYGNKDMAEGMENLEHNISERIKCSKYHQILTCPEWGVEFPSSATNIEKSASRTSVRNLTISSPPEARVTLCYMLRDM